MSFLRIRRAAAVPALTAVALLAASSSAQAHRPWLEPAATNFSGDDPWVSVDAAISNDLFYADHFPMNPETIKAVGPDGRDLAIENVAKGRYRTTFDVHLVQPGTTRIFTTTANLGGTYVVDGQTYRLGGFRGGGNRPGGQGAPGGARDGGPTAVARMPGAPAPGGGREGGGREGGGPGEGRPQALQGVSDPAQIPANATDIKLVQSTSRTETFVTRGAPTPLKPTGVGLELAATGTSPTDLVADEAATFQLLLDGKPAGNVPVTVVAANQRFGTAPEDLKLATDAQGRVTVKWPTPGFYWVNASAEGPAAAANTRRRASYAMIVEVQKP